MIKIKEIGFLAKEASKIMSVASSESKNKALTVAANEIVKKTEEILSANYRDLSEAKKKGLTPVSYTHLTLPTKA